MHDLSPFRTLRGHTGRLEGISSCADSLLIAMLAHQLENVTSSKPDGEGDIASEVSLTWESPARMASRSQSGLRTGSKTHILRSASKLRKTCQDHPLPVSDFHLLLDRLAQAHYTELEAARVAGSNSGVSSQPMGPLRERGISSDTTQMEAAHPSPQLSPSMGALLAARLRRTSEASSASVTADRILKAWEAEGDLLPNQEMHGGCGEDTPELPCQQKGAKVGLLRRCLLSARFEVAMSCLVLANTVWMAAQLQAEGSILGSYLRGDTDLSSLSTTRSVFVIGEQCFAAIFVFEVWLRVIVLRGAFFMVWLNYIDFFVGISCMAELIMVIKDGHDNSLDSLFLLRLLRVGKLARGLKLVGLTSNLAPLQLLVLGLLSNLVLLSSFPR